MKLITIQQNNILNKTITIKENNILNKINYDSRK